jgi:hypothetical protein
VQFYGEIEGNPLADAAGYQSAKHTVLMLACRGQRGPLALWFVPFTDNAPCVPRDHQIFVSRDHPS